MFRVENLTVHDESRALSMCQRSYFHARFQAKLGWIKINFKSNFYDTGTTIPVLNLPKFVASNVSVVIFIAIHYIITFRLFYIKTDTYRESNLLYEIFLFRKTNSLTIAFQDVCIKRETNFHNNPWQIIFPP